MHPRRRPSSAAAAAKLEMPQPFPRVVTSRKTRKCRTAVIGTPGSLSLSPVSTATLARMNTARAEPSASEEGFGIGPTREARVRRRGEQRPARVRLHGEYRTCR